MDKKKVNKVLNSMSNQIEHQVQQEMKKPMPESEYLAWHFSNLVCGQKDAQRFTTYELTDKQMKHLQKCQRKFCKHFNVSSKQLGNLFLGDAEDSVYRKYNQWCKNNLPLIKFSLAK